MGISQRLWRSFLSRAGVGQSNSGMAPDTALTDVDVSTHAHVMADDACCLQPLTKYIKGKNVEEKKVASGKPVAIAVRPRFKFTEVEDSFEVSYYLPFVTTVRALPTSR